MENNRNLPERIYLNRFKGDYKQYIDAVYDIFKKDFIDNNASFGVHNLKLKFHPLFQDRASAFYHITHEGPDEENRTPDLRRCECIPWPKPTLKNADNWSLKFWRQTRKRSENRICVWLDNAEGIDYFIVIEVRATYILLWTTFVSEYSHNTKKKESEYIQWLKQNNNKVYSPDTLIAEIQNEILKKLGSPNT